MDATTGAAQELRAAFDRARETGTAQEARAAAVAFYRLRAAEGGTQASTASELGVSKFTLAKWHQRESPRSAPSARVTSSEMDSEGEALRAEVGGFGPRSPSRRLPEELKRRVVAWAEARRACGAGTAELEQRVGIPWTSLSKWMTKSSPRPSSPLPLKPVSVVPARAGSHPILKTPSGLTVEGLDVDGLAELLRRLG